MFSFPTCWLRIFLPFQALLEAGLPALLDFLSQLVNIMALKPIKKKVKYNSSPYPYL